MSKNSIYLTTPILNSIDLDKEKILGKFTYSKLSLSYNFIDVFTELEIEAKFPFALKISCHHFINNSQAESKVIEVRVKFPYDLKDDKELDSITFDEFSLLMPPQFVFDMPHARANNIFFVITLMISKTSYEIGKIFTMIK